MQKSSGPASPLSRASAAIEGLCAPVRNSEVTLSAMDPPSLRGGPSGDTRAASKYGRLCVSVQRLCIDVEVVNQL
ncbi:hypothetical protein GCM10017557_57350 [Streptomyces aurantiacus]|uniref:Uncharacterized protein n=1 Tax=Streptomyces aurantiacus TaxID=47760 RepID=A0A7G1PAJ4_9ACTN|nr:hypothetical protein GCM10017557_57350 [Streptomyces aurantiacus]